MNYFVLGNFFAFQYQKINIARKLANETSSGFPPILVFVAILLMK